MNNYNDTADFDSLIKYEEFIATLEGRRMLKQIAEAFKEEGIE